MSAYAGFRLALIRRIHDEKLTPNQVADALEAEGLGQLCWKEISDYRSLGDTWRNLADRAWCGRCRMIQSPEHTCLIVL